MLTRKGILLILDGYGEGKSYAYNAVENADTPFLKKIKKEQPNCLLYTDGNHVGLPNGTMGGSEVGHMTIGSGKIKRSMQVKIDDEIKSGEFFKEHVLVEQFQNLKNRNGALHIGGLWSDKQVHSSIHHCIALLKMAKMFGIKKVFVHAFTDGRDTEQKCCMRYFDMVDKAIKEIRIGEIATLGGRFYIMDRENNLERTACYVDKILTKDYDFETVKEAVDLSYNKNIYDEFIVPVRIKTKENYAVSKDDLFVFFNTRADRMKQPVKMASDKLGCQILTLCNFVEASNIAYVYDEDFVSNCMTEYLSNLDKKVLKISESTKYAHVTYFFNGGREEPFKNEQRIHVITQKTDDYALTPCMRANEITTELIKAVNSKEFDCIVVNYSNPDMIGHTGNYEAAVTALECIDKCVKQVVDVAEKNNYFILLCADHGNAECMRDANNEPQTAHTLNPVKCLVIDKDNQNIKMHDGGLKDVAPTFIKLMKIEQNPDFEGKPLF